MKKRITDLHPRTFLAFAASLVTTLLNAQYNDKGTVHLAVGPSFGIHSTRYEQRIVISGAEFPETTNDGAATITYPIQVGYGFSRLFSLGLLIEPGSYLDSNATRSNSLIIYGVEPRFHVVNKDRFAWMVGGQFGGSSLTIQEQGQNVSEAKYSGSLFGLDTGVAFLFTEHFGLQIHLRYLATRMPLKDFSLSGSSIVLSNFEAELNTSGVALQTSLAFRF
ncbi:MAG: hypothetical protein KDC00_01645 [Flavobacteriales bacterium]|nr:hypothetical protein [Flavobacteriales bacterium]